MNKVKVKISEIIPLDDNIHNPILTHFQHGILSTSGCTEMNSVLATDEGKPNERIIISSNNDNVYTGSIRDSQKDFIKKYIGIRNKTTNKIRMIEVEQCSMISHLYHKPPIVTQVENIEVSKNDLMRLFGGKRATQILDRQEKMQVNLDVIKSQMINTLNEMDETSNGKLDDFDEGKLEREELIESMLPVCNAEAKHLQDVYKITDLIDESLLGELTDVATELMNTNEDELPINMEFVKKIILNIINEKSNNQIDKLLKLKICIYIDALGTFVNTLKTTKKNMQNISFSMISNSVDQHIRQNFSQPNKIKLSKGIYTMQKAFSYIIVLTVLISEKYTVSAENIIQSLNISKQQISKLANAVKIRYTSSTNMLQLVLPSQIQPRKRFVQKRRR